MTWDFSYLQQFEHLFLIMQNRHKNHVKISK